MGFKQYESKPITRTAYQVREGDQIHAVGECQFIINIDGNDVAFKAYEPVEVGDFIVYLADDDIYHCREAVFRERNYVD